MATILDRIDPIDPLNASVDRWSARQRWRAITGPVAAGIYVAWILMPWRIFEFCGAIARLANRCQSSHHPLKVVVEFFIVHGDMEFVINDGVVGVVEQEILLNRDQ